MEEKYFAAANSGEGFVSYFGEVFGPDAFEHVYIIKGGPGTGKSFFMRRVAEEAERQGERVVYWYCSSDPDSLDGITVGDRFALLDGTAPHDVGCRAPGAVENIVDLGAFWSVPSLTVAKAEIQRLNRKKGEAYRSAYRFLSIHARLSEAVEELVFPFVDGELLEKTARELLAGVPDGDGYEISTALCDSVGMKGRVRFDTYERFSQRAVRIRDHFGTAHLLLSALACEARRRNMKIMVSYDPIRPQRMDALSFGGTVAFCISEEEAELDMKGFMRSDFDSHDAQRIYGFRSVIFSEAVSSLEEVRKTHFKIEEIYQSAMDFDLKEKYTEKFIRQVIKKSERG